MRFQGLEGTRDTGYLPHIITNEPAAVFYPQFLELRQAYCKINDHMHA